MPFKKIKDIQVFYKVFVNKKEMPTLDPEKPAMIVLHGGFGIVDHQIEVPAWIEFSHQLQLIFIDQRGCGKTEDGDAALWTMDQFGDDIFNFIQGMGLKKVIVAGISAGGYATIAYATRHPQQPSALILLNTEAVVSPAEKKQAYVSLANRTDKREFFPFQNLSESEIIDYANKAGQASYQYDINPTHENFVEFAKWGYSLLSKTPYDLIKPARDNLFMKEKFANGYEKFNYLTDMHKISCPVLWFAGEWDSLHPKSSAEKSVAHLPNARLCILPAGAPVYHDAQEEFMRRASRFIAEQCL